MDRFDDNIFQTLISDTNFIRWAKGKSVAHPEKWEEWPAAHPEHIGEFNEAMELVKILTYRTPEISKQEVQYLWKETSGRMHGLSVSNIRKLVNTAIRVAAILFIPLMVYTSWVYFNKHQLETKYTDLLEYRSKQDITVVSPTGARTLVNLPDGTKVWLNAESSITYPSVFYGDARKVKVEGEAFFKVTKSHTPFEVENLGPEVKVYGTQFNVNSYSDENMVTVALVEGKVALKVNGQEQFLAPGQVSFFNKEKQTLAIQNEDITPFVCWREGKLIFRDTPLNAILRTLQRQYNVEIDLTDSVLGDYKYNATLQNENLDQILELLELSAPVKCRYQKGGLKSDGTYSKGKVLISKDNKRVYKP